MSLTDDEVRRVLAVPKRVSETIEWKLRAGSTPSFECTFSVRVPAGGESGEAILGKVVATHNRHETKCAFIYHGVCIRRWESAGSHPNPDGRRIEGQHKHGWDEAHGDQYAYVPDDIDTTSRDTIPMSCLRECAALMSGLEGDA